MPLTLFPGVPKARFVAHGDTSKARKAPTRAARIRRAEPPWGSRTKVGTRSPIYDECRVTTYLTLEAGTVSRISTRRWLAKTVRYFGMSTFEKPERRDFPTILIVGNDDSLAVLIEPLQLDGYLVLLASNCDDAMRVVSIHSRPIHLIAADRSVDGPTLGEKLKPLRLGTIPFLYVSGQPNAVLEEVRKFIEPPPRAPKQRGHAA
jgi:hypothetical protein